MTTVDWRAAVHLATLAPSIHNTQPWRFDAAEDSIEVWADRTRALPSLDPSGRQLVVSCGAATEHLCLALSAQGWPPTVDVLPDPATPDLLARIRLGLPSPPSPADLELASAIPHRTTVRAPFEPQAISTEDLDALRRAVALTGAWLHPVVRSEGVVALAVLLQHAEVAEQADPAYRSELHQWRRGDRSPDGVPDAAISTLEGRHTSFALRDFSTDDDSPETSTGAPVDEHPLAVIVGTHGDGVADWLVAGRGVARLLLRATTLGVSASPLNQVIDDPGSRQQLRSHLGLVGHPQMVLRMGYAQAVPMTGRRPLDEVLTVVGGRRSS